jgi:phosphoserine phosphatase
MEDKSTSTGVVAITATGKDKPGLIAEMTEAIAHANGNIVDIDAFSIRGLFAIFMIVDCRAMVTPFEELRSQLMDIGDRIGLTVDLRPWVPGRRRGEKKLVLLTTIGKDRPGIVAKVSRFLHKSNVNIERIRMIAHGELNCMEIHADASEISTGFLDFRSGVKDVCREVGQDVVVQMEDSFHRPKKLVVFDVDSTLIDVEVIDKLAEAAGVSEEVKEITEQAMNGEIDFKQALRKRAKSLKGLSVEVLEGIADNLKVTPGARELITALKALGYKTALISGGFTYFVDRIGKSLGIDYVYANKLLIHEGRLTGEVEEPIIDDRRKGELVRHIAEKENLLMEEVVAVGDGANDRFMLKDSGLGIAVNPKDILKSVADGVIKKENIIGILYCVGAPGKKLKEFFNKNYVAEEEP